MYPLVSIIVPVYKAGNYLRKCVDSILAQTYENFEIILVDDGSPDRCGEICDEYVQKDKRIRVFHKDNGGVWSARQCGLEHAQGEYVIHVDPDDWVESTYLEDLYAEAKEENADIIICDFTRVYADYQHIERVNPPLDSQDFIVALLYGRLHAALWNKLIRRDLYVQHNIQFIPGVNIMEDLAVLVRLAYFAQHISYINKSLYNYNKMNEGSCTSNFFNDQHCDNYFVLERVLFTFFRTHPCRPDVFYAVQQKHVSLVAATLFYASTEFLQKYRHSLRGYTVKDVLCHPTLSIHYKLMALFNILHLDAFIKLFRRMIRIKK